MNILFLGDVVGKPGREAVAAKLPAFRRFQAIDLCIANGENSADGNGVTADSAEELFAAGVDVLTGGNHTFRRREAYDYIAQAPYLIRPANVSPAAPGKGVCVYDMGSCAVAVMNLVGASYMDPCDNPFRKADELLAALDPFVKTVVVDFHAETTGEKRALAEYLAGRVSAVIGTHTHVQTADERVLEGGTAFITDAGMCGPTDSVLGVKKELAIGFMLDRMPTRFAVADGETALGGVIIRVDGRNGRAESIERIQITV